MRRWVAALAVLLVAGCTPAPAAPSTASRQTPAEADRTLASLRQIDDLPLYEMTYEGDYDPLSGTAGKSSGTPFGCSLFVASGDPARPLFGRNFDWDPNPALVLHTDPPDGYASISIVDMSYLDGRLLDAPLLPFDGMNERGLAVGLAADTTGHVTPDNNKPTIGGVRILRLILDHAATVDEAIRILDRYTLDFSGGPPLHYLLADAAGGSAVVEFDGAMRVLRGAPPWQALTNIRLAGADDATRAQDRRYATASDTLEQTNGALDWRQAMDLLRAVAQPHTRWSVTYELRTGAVHVVTAKRWGTVHPFQLGTPRTTASARTPA